MELFKNQVKERKSGKLTNDNLTVMRGKKDQLEEKLGTTSFSQGVKFSIVSLAASINPKPNPFVALFFYGQPLPTSGHE